MKACDYHIPSAGKYFFLCVLIKPLWVGCVVVLLLFCLGLLFSPLFYVSSFRMGFLNGEDQLLIVH